MVLLEPVDGVGVEEVADLVTPEVEDVRAPLLVPAALRVGVLVERRAVEADEGPRVGGEVARHPVEDHADPGLVETVDEPLQPVGVTEAGVGREVGRDVIAPRAAERVLHHRHELHVREAQVAEVGDEGVGNLVPGVEVAAVVLAPRRQVHLVDGHGLGHRLLGPTIGDPGVVAPDMARLPDHRGRARRLLGVLRQGVGPVGPLAVGATDAELVLHSHAGAVDEGVPDTGVGDAGHRVARPVPAGPLARHLDLHRVGCPDAEGRAGVDDLGAQHGPELLVPALVDEVEVELSGCVRVIGACHGVPLRAASGMETQPGRLRAS